MIQGGGYTDTLTEKPTRPPIQNEATNGLRNARGTVAMARLATLRSATAQFYINIVDNRSLDHTGYSPSRIRYAVFGRVLSGMDVADRIAAVATAASGDMEDVPVEAGLHQERPCAEIEASLPGHFARRRLSRDGQRRQAMAGPPKRAESWPRAKAAGLGKPDQPKRSTL